VQGDGLAVDVAVVKVLALENAGHVELAHEFEHVSQVERLDPIAVVNDSRVLGIENLHGLLDVGPRVFLDLLLREGWTSAVAPRRVADKGRAVADDEGDVMAELLELPHLAQRNRVTEVKVGARGVHTQLDVEGRALLELLPELVQRHDLHRPRSNDLELLVDWQHCSVLHVKSTLRRRRTRRRAGNRITQLRRENGRTGPRSASPQNAKHDDVHDNSPFPKRRNAACAV